MEKPHIFTSFSVLLLLWSCVTIETPPEKPDILGFRTEVVTRLGPGLLRVGYLSARAVDHRGPALEAIPFEKLTHLILAFAWMDEEGLLRRDFITPSLLDRVGEIKKNHPHLRVMISLGGARGSSGFSRILQEDELYAGFFRDLDELLQDPVLDGVDLDWEFPVEDEAKGPFYPEEGPGFHRLVGDLRTFLDSKNRNLQLSLALSFLPRHLRHLDLKTLSRQADFISLMTYNFAGPWSRTVGHQAPLGPELKSEISWKRPPSPVYSPQNVTESALLALDRGLDRSKTLIGIPVYGRMWYYNEPGKSLYEPKSALDHEDSLWTLPTDLITMKNDPEGNPARGWITRDELLSPGDDFTGFEIKNDHKARATMVFDRNKNRAVSLESGWSYEKKLRWIQDWKWAGLMFWELTQDRDSILLKVLSDAVRPE